jgi:hypothetical protein
VTARAASPLSTSLPPTPHFSVTWRALTLLSVLCKGIAMALLVLGLWPGLCLILLLLTVLEDLWAMTVLFARRPGA